jgi:hypothetical protein
MLVEVHPGGLFMRIHYHGSWPTANLATTSLVVAFCDLRRVSLESTKVDSPYFDA